MVAGAKHYLFDITSFLVQLSNLLIWRLLFWAPTFAVLVKLIEYSARYHPTWIIILSLLKRCDYEIY